MSVNKMKDPLMLKGEKIYLRPLAVQDVNDTYCGWMNDREVLQFTESRFSKHSLDSIRAYVEKEANQAGVTFLAVVLKATDQHVGSIKIHRVDKNHKHAEMSLLLGDKSSWGKGLGTEAISLMAEYGFSQLGLHKIFAQCYADNHGSIKAFKKAGFKQEGQFKDHYWLHDRYIDGVFLALINPERTS